MSTGSLAYALALMERYPDSFSGTLKEDTIQKILDAQQADGSFEYTAGAGFSDPDSTAQAMQGLLLLGDCYAAEAQAAGDWLAAQMNEDGVLAIDWGTGPTPNPSSTAQALIAFAQKGEVPANDQGKTLYDGIMTLSLIHILLRGKLKISDSFPGFTFARRRKYGDNCFFNSIVVQFG